MNKIFLNIILVKSVYNYLLLFVKALLKNCIQFYTRLEQLNKAQFPPTFQK